LRSTADTTPNRTAGLANTLALGGTSRSAQPYRRGQRVAWDKHPPVACDNVLWSLGHFPVYYHSDVLFFATP